MEAAGAPALHLDVMDGHFVPNISIGMPIVEAVRRMTELPLDVHLMISRPDEYVERFRKAGADSLTIHVEAATIRGRCWIRFARWGARRVGDQSADAAIGDRSELAALRHRAGDERDAGFRRAGIRRRRA